MNKKAWTTILIIAIAIIIVGVVMYYRDTSGAPKNNFKQTVSTPEITFGIPDDFGLAVTKEQILAKAYIPPCGDNFDYCLYYIGNQYSGTNFESAGLRIKKRTDLTSQGCLTAEPAGYSGLEPVSTKFGKYSMALFDGLGEGAAGHYSLGRLYRLSLPTGCYEFETRIGESQYANYPAGQIKQFTKEDEQAMQSRLEAIIGSVQIK